jgi:hypothetical protein
MIYKAHGRRCFERVSYMKIYFFLHLNSGLFKHNHPHVTAGDIVVGAIIHSSIAPLEANPRKL